MTTQPFSLEPGSPAPDRSRRRVADHPAAPSPSSRRPRRTCPEPVGGACPEPVEGGPSCNQHPRPTAVPRQSAPPNSPSPRLPTRPSHLVRTAPLTRPELAQFRPPAPLKSFLEKTLTRAQHPGVLVQNPAVLAHPSSRRLQPGPSGNQQARVSVPPRQSRVPSLTVS